jgi:hypothetical protein
MNGKVSKMLRRLNANDKRSKRLYQDLEPEQKGRIRAAYKANPDNPGKALVAMMKELGNIE